MSILPTISHNSLVWDLSKEISGTLVSFTTQQMNHSPCQTQRQQQVVWRAKDEEAGDRAQNTQRVDTVCYQNISVQIYQIKKSKKIKCRDTLRKQLQDQYGDYCYSNRNISTYISARHYYIKTEMKKYPNLTFKYK